MHQLDLLWLAACRKVAIAREEIVVIHLHVNRRQVRR
jgi:hypothetical protein